MKNEEKINECLLSYFRYKITSACAARPSFNMAAPSPKPGYGAFLTHLEALGVAITDPGSLAVQLYAQGLIDRLNHQRAGLTTLAPLERSNGLLTALDSRLATDDGAFDKFISILSSDPVMEEMCKKLWQTRGK